MTPVERVARAMAAKEYADWQYSTPWWGDADSQPVETILLTREQKERYRILARTAVEALMEPSEGMVRRSIVQTDITDAHLDFGAGVIEGMPPLPFLSQRQGITAAAEVYRDWQAMLHAALDEGLADRGAT